MDNPINAQSYKYYSYTKLYVLFSLMVVIPFYIHNMNLSILDQPNYYATCESIDVGPIKGYYYWNSLSNME